MHNDTGAWEAVLRRGYQFCLDSCGGRIKAESMYNKDGMVGWPICTTAECSNTLIAAYFGFPSSPA